MKNVQQYSDLTKFGDTLSVLFKLKWDQVETLKSIENASKGFDERIDSAEYKLSVKQIEAYLNTYKSRELYFKAKRIIINEQTVQTLNNHLMFTY